MDALIIDDSVIVRQRLVDVLLTAGFNNVYEVETTEEAIIINKEHQISIIITEIFLNQKSEIHFLSELKKDNPLCRILVFTNSTSSFHKKKSIEAGANYFLDKSTEVEKLFDLIRKLSK